MRIGDDKRANERNIVSKELGVGGLVVVKEGDMYMLARVTRRLVTLVHACITEIYNLMDMAISLILFSTYLYCSLSAHVMLLTIAITTAYISKPYHPYNKL